MAALGGRANWDSTASESRCVAFESADTMAAKAEWDAVFMGLTITCLPEHFQTAAFFQAALSKDGFGMKNASIFKCIAIAMVCAALLAEVARGETAGTPAISPQDLPAVFKALDDDAGEGHRACFFLALLDECRVFIKPLPASEHFARAKETAELREKMVVEDPAHAKTLKGPVRPICPTKKAQISHAAEREYFFEMKANFPGQLG